MATYNEAEATSIAAIMLGFCETNLMRKVHDVVEDHLEFYSMAKDGAVFLEREAKKQGIEWGEDADWIITMENFSKAILEFVLSKGGAPTREIDWRILFDLSVDRYPPR